MNRTHTIIETNEGIVEIRTKEQATVYDSDGNPVGHARTRALPAIARGNYETRDETGKVLAFDAVGYEAAIEERLAGLPGDRPAALAAIQTALAERDNLREQVADRDAEIATLRQERNAERAARQTAQQALRVAEARIVD